MVLPTEGGEHFVKKIIKIIKERVCRALNAQRKQQMAWGFDKKTNAMHRILCLDWALEAKNAQVVGHNEIFHKLMERNKTEPNEQRSDRNRQSDENNRFAFLLGVEKVTFLMEKGVVRFSKM